jgi:hypothetical protein
LSLSAVTVLLSPQAASQRLVAEAVSLVSEQQQRWTN